MRASLDAVTKPQNQKQQETTEPQTRRSNGTDLDMNWR